MEELKFCDWCDEEFEECELTKTSLGYLCDCCIREIESRGESVYDFDDEE